MQQQICPKCRTRFENRVERCPHDGRRVVADLTGVVVSGRYLLRELLGVGGMDSSVWLAMQQPVQRPVAVKLLPPTDGEAADRFARGARIASNLSHPNITVVHDYGLTENGQLYLVMELLEGRILHDVLKGGALPIDQALHITDQVLKALDHAHKRNVVHRDIKPGNLFLCSRNEDPDFLKVLDFGIARFIDIEDASTDEAHQEITTARQICGTPQYMAPEQIAMGTVDARTDLYALGVVLYRMVTGDLPFQSKNHRDLFRAHLTQTPPTFASVNPGLQLPELEALVMRSLAKSPDDRFASAAEMRTALRQLRVRMAGGVDDEFTPMSSVAQASAVRSPTTLSIDAPKPQRKLAVPLGVLLLVALVSIFFWTQRPQTPRGVDGGALGTKPPAGPGTDAPVRVSPPTVPPAPVPPAPVPPAPDAGTVPSEPVPPPASAPAPATDAAPIEVVRTGRVQVTSAPAGARIRLDGVDLGLTPRVVTLPVGAHRLLLVRGAALATLAVEVKEGGKMQSFHGVLRQAAAPSSAGPASRPPAVEAPASVAAPKDVPPTVRLKLLDEGEARDFKADDGRPASPVSTKPKVDLLE